MDDAFENQVNIVLNEWGIPEHSEARDKLTNFANRFWLAVVDQLENYGCYHGVVKYDAKKYDEAIAWFDYLTDNLAFLTRNLPKEEFRHLYHFMSLTWDHKYMVREHLLSQKRKVSKPSDGSVRKCDEWLAFVLYSMFAKGSDPALRKFAAKLVRPQGPIHSYFNSFIKGYIDLEPEYGNSDWMIANTVRNGFKYEDFNLPSFNSADEDPNFARDVRYRLKKISFEHFKSSIRLDLVYFNLTEAHIKESFDHVFELGGLTVKEVLGNKRWDAHTIEESSYESLLKYYFGHKLKRPSFKGKSDF